VRRCKDVLALHLSDVPDASAAERSIIRRASVLTVELELLEARFATAGEASAADLDLYHGAPTACAVCSKRLVWSGARKTSHCLRSSSTLRTRQNSGRARAHKADHHLARCARGPSAARPCPRRRELAAVAPLADRRQWQGIEQRGARGLRQVHRPRARTVTARERACCSRRHVFTEDEHCPHT